MIEYIKKLRICTRWYIELEDGYLAEQEKLRSMYEAEEKRRAEIGKCCLIGQSIILDKKFCF